jgi:MraZ protein
MFRGQFEHSIDGKGRLSIPAKFRDALQTPSGGRLVLTAQDRCIYAYGLADFEEIERKLSAQQQTSIQRAFMRRFVGGSQECEIDPSGRILVPPSLRSYGALSREVMLVGVAKHFEIWAMDRWKEEDARNAQLVAANRDFIPDI